MVSLLVVVIVVVAEAVVVLVLMLFHFAEVPEQARSVFYLPKRESEETSCRNFEQ